MDRNPGDAMRQATTDHRARSVAMVAAGLVVAALLSIGGVRAAAMLTAGEASSIDTAVSGVFNGADCVRPADALDRVQTALVAAGGEGWSVRLAQGAATASCVSAGIAGDDRTVVLIPALGGSVAAAAEQVGAELMDRCMDRDTAVRFLSSWLTSLGIPDASVRTDGPLAYPADQEAAVRAHVAAGCFVFSGSGSDGSGRPVFYLSGPSH